MEFVRTLAHPGHASPPAVGAWALECERKPSVIVLENAQDLTPGPPPAATLFLWCGVPLAEGLDAALSCLSRSERVEVSRYHNEADRLSVAVARAVARVQIGILLSCPPDEVGLVRSAAGKPGVDPGRHGALASSVHFSVSHARGLVAVGISGTTMGIDVEAVRHLPDMRAVARTAFAQEVSQMIAAEGEEGSDALFFRLWVLGEAFVKGTGQGVSQGLDSFVFTPHGKPRLERVSETWGPPERWTFGMWPDAERAASEN